MFFQIHSQNKSNHQREAKATTTTVGEQPPPTTKGPGQPAPPTQKRMGEARLKRKGENNTTQKQRVNSTTTCGGGRQHDPPKKQGKSSATEKGRGGEAPSHKGRLRKQHHPKGNGSLLLVTLLLTLLRWAGAGVSFPPPVGWCKLCVFLTGSLKVFFFLKKKGVI